MIWGIARYEMRMQLRSLVFWLVLALAGLFFYTELVDEPIHRMEVALSYQRDPEGFKRLWQNPERTAAEMEQRLAEGWPAVQASDTFADRMQIVFTFGTLFAAAFVLERDRLSRAKEVLLPRPVRPLDYLIGKFLGISIPLLAGSGIALVTSIGVHIYVQGMVGAPWSSWPYLRAGFVLLAPTILYSAAVVLTLSTVLRRPAVVVPLFLGYEILGGVAPLRPKGTFDLTMFVARTENLGYSLWNEGLTALVLNRSLYLLLTGALLYVAARLYQRRFDRGEAL